jgi:tetratricopeptide (TPR) repeat protein
MDELAAYNAQAMQLREQGRLLEAIRLLERALPELRQTLGGHHDITLAAMSNLGALLIEAKMFAEAEPYCREVVQRRRGALGDNDQSTIRSMTNLASLLQAQGKIDAAVEQWREVVTAQRQGLGSRHEGTLTAIGNLAVTLLEQSKEELEEPVALLTEELRVRVATLGKGCLKSLPQLTGALLRRLYDALFAQPNLGADVEGYELLMGYVKAAMGGE